MIPAQTLIVNLRDGRIGVTCPDLMNCCTDTEVPVVYEGTSSFEGTEVAQLEVIGPENARPEPDRCGAGRGADCCKYLTVGPSGFECERFGNLRHLLRFKSDMIAKRDPIRMFPQCFLPKEPVDAAPTSQQ